MILSGKVGTEIDEHENRFYRIFPKEKGFVNNKKAKKGMQILAGKVADAASAIFQKGFIEQNIQTGSKSSISSNKVVVELLLVVLS